MLTGPSRGVSQVEPRPGGPRDSFRMALSLCLLPGCLNPQPLEAGNPGAVPLPATEAPQRERSKYPLLSAGATAATGLFNLMHYGLPGCPW